MSSAAPKNGIPIDPADLARFTKDTQLFMRKAAVRAAIPDDFLKQGTASGVKGFSFSASSPGFAEHSASILEAAQAVSGGGDTFLLSEGAHHALLAIRTGLAVGLHLSGLYSQMSNLDSLIAQNRGNTLALSQNEEIVGKRQTASAIALFTAAYYIAYDLSRYRSEELGSIEIQDFDPPATPLNAPRQALLHLAFWIGKRAELSDAQASDLAFAKCVLQVARKYAEQMESKKAAFHYDEAFLDTTYLLKGSEFSVHGFTTDFSGKESRVEFNRTKFEEIVGNRDAKHVLRRYCYRLVCYDPEVKDNPFRVLGGIPRLLLGHGIPGTGKSMLIAATATKLDELCDQIGLPFLFNPLPDGIISTFQGGSAERMLAWFKTNLDPSKIVYAPIDDAENNLEDRTRQGVSAGVREVIGVFLRNTEGAYAVDRGNALIPLFTNLAEQIDPAVRSRIVDRFQIDGARTGYDFVDQNYLWSKQYRELDGGFINLRAPKGYEHLSAQKPMANLGEFYQEYAEPRERIVKELVAAADKAVKDRASEDWFAELLTQTCGHYEMFSSRDVRNIQSAVSGRVMDFDLPDDWIDHPDKFFRKPFDEKHTLLKGLMKENMKGLRFSDVLFQESIRYLDSYSRIADAEFEREVKRRIDSLRVEKEALSRFEKGRPDLAKKALSAI